jgi:uncharacterized membrane protein
MQHDLPGRPPGDALGAQAPVATGSPLSRGSPPGPWATRWHRHPAVRSFEELTVGERAADLMRNGMGSWTFVFGALGFLTLWIMVNVVAARAGSHSFDVDPFILLNLVLSCLAAMQGAILLIAAKRADQVASELAAHDYAVNRRAERLIEENTELTRSIKELTQAIHHHVVTPPATALFVPSQAAGPTPTRHPPTETHHERRAAHPRRGCHLIPVRRPG